VHSRYDTLQATRLTAATNTIYHTDYVRYINMFLTPIALKVPRLLAVHILQKRDLKNPIPTPVHFASYLFLLLYTIANPNIYFYTTISV